jgi:predicted amidophosphoribosyltransferase
MNIHCSACGAPLPTGAKVCPACALPLTAIDAHPGPAQGEGFHLAIVLYAVAFVVNAFGFLWVVSRFL